jgi:hypothetical protein
MKIRSMTFFQPTQSLSCALLPSLLDTNLCGVSTAMSVMYAPLKSSSFPFLVPRAAQTSCRAPSSVVRARAFSIKRSKKAWNPEAPERRLERQNPGLTAFTMTGGFRPKRAANARTKRTFRTEVALSATQA